MEIRTDNLETWLLTSDVSKSIQKFQTLYACLKAYTYQAVRNVSKWVLYFKVSKSVFKSTMFPSHVSIQLLPASALWWFLNINLQFFIIIFETFWCCQDYTDVSNLIHLFPTSKLCFQVNIAPSKYNIIISTSNWYFQAGNFLINSCFQIKNVSKLCFQVNFCKEKLWWFFWTGNR